MGAVMERERGLEEVSAKGILCFDYGEEASHSSDQGHQTVCIIIFINHNYTVHMIFGHPGRDHEM